MERKKIIVSEDMKVVTKNEFIKGCGMEGASLKATKLLYIAIAQCRKTDKEFYEYSLTIPEFAAIMDIDPSNIYQEVDAITDELTRAFIRVSPKKEGKSFKKRTVFACCDYEDGEGLYFKINKDMTDLLLGITGDFSQPLLNDFMKMKSVYSIKVWHLLQMKMKSQKPAFMIEGKEPEYYVSVEELRKVTGTENKLKQIGELKKRVLDKACREIEECAGIRMEYKNKKHGKQIIGFLFHVNPQFSITQEQADYYEEKYAEYEKKKNTDDIEGQLTFTEYLRMQKEKKNVNG